MTLGCYPMASGEPLDCFVGHLVDDILEKGLSIGLLLMDRGGLVQKSMTIGS